LHKLVVTTISSILIHWFITVIKKFSMPLFMDRHDVSETVTAEIVAQIHQEDLKIQHKFNCRGLTYWFDEERKTAFCLIEAPDRNSIIEMHDHAHGQVPHQIIEVEEKIVESFLGRIEDPENARNTKLNIINDPAFRTIMVVSIAHHSFQDADPGLSISKVRHYFEKITPTLDAFEGRIVEQREDVLLISFRKVTKAVECALKMKEIYKTFRTQNQINFTELSIGLHAGVPVTEKNSIFEGTIKLAERMRSVSIAEIVISTDVQQLYKSENRGDRLNKNQVHVLTAREEKFINKLMEFIETEWQNNSLRVEDIEKSIGISKSKLYREMIRLSGKSPVVFLLHFRLQKSLMLLQKQKGNISEIAYESGFNSSSYFTRCFRKKYGIIPSELLQT